jgi:hypothetical protein
MVPSRFLARHACRNCLRRDNTNALSSISPIGVETNLLPPIHLAVGGTSRLLEGVTSQATSSPEPQNEPRSNRKSCGLNRARWLLRLNWTMNGTEPVHIRWRPDMNRKSKNRKIKGYGSGYDSEFWHFSIESQVLFFSHGCTNFLGLHPWLKNRISDWIFFRAIWLADSMGVR